MTSSKMLLRRQGSSLIDEAVKSAITDKPDNLGTMAGLIRSLEPDLLPPDVESYLIKLRNIAIHGRNRTGKKRWDQITLHEAVNAFRSAVAIIDAAHPLADRLG